jgi:hypothetical protein
MELQWSTPNSLRYYCKMSNTTYRVLAEHKVTKQRTSRQTTRSTVRARSVSLSRSLSSLEAEAKLSSPPAHLVHAVQRRKGPCAAPPLVCKLSELACFTFVYAPNDCWRSTGVVAAPLTHQRQAKARRCLPCPCPSSKQLDDCYPAIGPAKWGQHVQMSQAKQRVVRRYCLAHKTVS